MARILEIPRFMNPDAHTLQAEANLHNSVQLMVHFMTTREHFTYGVNNNGFSKLPWLAYNQLYEEHNYATLRAHMKYRHIEEPYGFILGSMTTFRRWFIGTTMNLLTLPNIENQLEINAHPVLRARQINASFDEAVNIFKQQKFIIQVGKGHGKSIVFTEMPMLRTRNNYFKATMQDNDPRLNTSWAFDVEKALAATENAAVGIAPMYPNIVNPPPVHVPAAQVPVQNATPTVTLAAAPLLTDAVINQVNYIKAYDYKPYENNHVHVTLQAAEAAPINDLVGEISKTITAKVTEYEQKLEELKQQNAELSAKLHQQQQLNWQ